MCVVCNCGDEGYTFLTHAYNVSFEMEKAAAAMLACSEVVEDKGAARRYDAAHKKIVRLRREWNRIEHEREAE
jgi:hypothetical protein